MSTFSKLKHWLVGTNEEYEYEDEFDDIEESGDEAYSPEPTPVPEKETRQQRRWNQVNAGGKGNVIDMHGALNGNYEVVLMEPRSFEEMPQAIQALRDRKMVVLNLTMMEPDQAQRAVDFVAGGTYAMDGHQERVGESIFLFTPLCVQVTTPGTLGHDLPQAVPTRPQRMSAPAPAWTGESTRIAQSG
ncbi:cell division protein SepF [Chroococcidiopsis sp.]|uniref:cell division protein SepF n=1 Tax=Chroococcidiopsis sp. TaxID=3088168 RepID=UPI000B64F041|nr:cell division protein SepF [cyanobacterium TDX16]